MDIAAIFPQLSGTAFYIIAFVVALSVIVAVHEYGHYIVGRWSGIKAEVFSLGFGPVLWSRMDKHGTRWQVAALPFGGYVKFLGDANAASAGTDEEVVADLTEEERRHTMSGAPLWARAATVAAGPVFNFALSIIVFTGVILTQGQTREPLTVGELRPLPAEVQELVPGDELISIGGQALPGFDDPVALGAFNDALPVEPTLEYRVRRDGAEITVGGPYPNPPIVTRLAPQSVAFDIGLEVGDVITSIDGTEIFAFSQLKERVEGGNGQPMVLKVWRAGTVMDFTLVPRRVDEPQDDGGFKTYWRIGIAGGMFFEPATETAGLGAAVTGGVKQTWRIITGSISGLWHMITGAISSCNMSGPIGIAQVSGQMASQGGESFVWFIAVLSTAVGLLNLFPIPVLDGGHLVFYAFEAVVGRPPSEKALRILMTLGLTLVLSVMLFALSNDLFCP
ncbi:RIP metalloprotease RseP [Alisedimentitalea sp. MJ-SS2]|uniref:RIP metalloprotease RseP n=1 Tax=Aliisedimentitalea sp. MJ-SS2 TaxID=3049795 RepID=UPI0029148DB7|nr:RIP metalloprotease RseP [Alisedimentitalea sp. MJ-SS2]MDU8929772.1 RIP metalloprotease RseP [Alisedimentitalea sp. MJ-SS2]